MGEPVRIGVLGATSGVARQAVLPAIERSGNCRLQATASLSDETASYGSYEELLRDEAIEAVYIPLPNSLHRHWTEEAAKAGKHVLCEKPLAANATDALAMEEACEKAGVVLMEAYMTAFHPRDALLGEIVASGEIGRFLSAHSQFTGVLDRPDDHRWHPEMGGGALLDLGIYCVTPLLRAAGIAPSGSEGVRAVAGSAHRNSYGVDSSFSGFLDLGVGRSGTFLCSFEAPERQSLEIVGTEGRIEVERAFTPGHSDRELVVRRRDGSEELFEAEGLDPYEAMVEHFGALVRGEAGEMRPSSDAVELQRLLDRLAFEAEPAAT